MGLEEAQDPHFQFPAPTRWLTTIPNSRPGGRTLGTTCAYAYMQAKYIHTISKSLGAKGVG